MNDKFCTFVWHFTLIKFFEGIYLDEKEIFGGGRVVWDLKPGTGKICPKHNQQ